MLSVSAIAPASSGVPIELRRAVSLELRRACAHRAALLTVTFIRHTTCTTPALACHTPPHRSPHAKNTTEVHLGIAWLVCDCVATALCSIVAGSILRGYTHMEPTRSSSAQRQVTISPCILVACSLRLSPSHHFAPCSLLPCCLSRRSFLLPSRPRGLIHSSPLPPTL